jgi:nucleoside triphosphate pyrophosphatase
MRLLLASASPRRAELLRAAHIEFDVVSADIDESVLPGESPQQHVWRLAEAKARTVLPRSGGRPVLAADTVVVVDGAILGKPTDAGDARAMLRLLSGRSHDVVTGVCLMWTGNAKGEGGSGKGEEGTGEGEQNTLRMGDRVAISEVVVTTVEFAPLSDAEIDWYIATGEPADKAGAYAIQGQASRFVTRIDGSYSNVVGLPIAVVYHLCRLAGLLIS